MLAFRSVARTAPRAVCRIATSSITKPARSAIFQAAKLSTPKFTAHFSTSRQCRATSGETDVELATKLESELQIEQETRDEDETPTSVKEYLENGPFEIEDVPGKEEVVLSRKFGDESIRVSFSIADLNNMDPESDFNDRALADEDDIDGEKQGEESDVDGEDVDPGDNSFPARVNVVIEKAGKGAMAIETVAQDGMIVIDNVYYYNDAKLAHAKTADLEHERQDKYVGPPFGNLDEDLQVLFERYLDERGINTALALFIPEYIDMKEQKEYVRWLESVKGFIEA